jgi:hypothetical protein
MSASRTLATPDINFYLDTEAEIKLFFKPKWIILNLQIYFLEMEMHMSSGADAINISGLLV